MRNTINGKHNILTDQVDKYDLWHCQQLPHTTSLLTFTECPIPFITLLTSTIESLNSVITDSIWMTAMISSKTLINIWKWSDRDTLVSLRYLVDSQLLYLLSVPCKFTLLYCQNFCYSTVKLPLTCTSCTIPFIAIFTSTVEPSISVITDSIWMTAMISSRTLINIWKLSTTSLFYTIVLFWQTKTFDRFQYN